MILLTFVFRNAIVVFTTPRTQALFPHYNNPLPPEYRHTHRNTSYAGKKKRFDVKFSHRFINEATTSIRQRGT